MLLVEIMVAGAVPRGRVTSPRMTVVRGLSGDSLFCLRWNVDCDFEGVSGMSHSPHCVWGGLFEILMAGAVSQLCRVCVHLEGPILWTVVLSAQCMPVDEA